MFGLFKKFVNFSRSLICLINKQKLYILPFLIQDCNPNKDDL